MHARLAAGQRPGRIVNGHFGVGVGDAIQPAASTILADAHECAPRRSFSRRRGALLLTEGNQSVVPRNALLAAYPAPAAASAIQNWT